VRETPPRSCRLGESAYKYVEWRSYRRCACLTPALLIASFQLLNSNVVSQLTANQAYPTIPKQLRKTHFALRGVKSEQNHRVSLKDLKGVKLRVCKKLNFETLRTYDENRAMLAKQRKQL